MARRQPTSLSIFEAGPEVPSDALQVLKRWNTGLSSQKPSESQMKLTATSAALILGLSTTVALAEGNLNIYNWGEYTSPELIDKFSKTYNIHMTQTDFDSNDTALAKVRQGSSGFDVVVPSQSFIPTYIQEGLLAETNPGQMENAKNL